VELKGWEPYRRYSLELEVGGRSRAGAESWSSELELSRNFELEL